MFTSYPRRQRLSNPSGNCETESTLGNSAEGAVECGSASYRLRFGLHGGSFAAALHGTPRVFAFSVPRCILFASYCRPAMLRSDSMSTLRKTHRSRHGPFASRRGAEWLAKAGANQQRFDFGNNRQKRRHGLLGHSLWRAAGWGTALASSAARQPLGGRAKGRPFWCELHAESSLVRGSPGRKNS